MLQFVFLGYTGFKWPVAYYLTTEAHASELMLLVWKVINTLETYGFEVRLLFVTLYAGCIFISYTMYNKE